jgi:branched-subunit amino acid aminotransferase/4-amino-4-deoxychorismate lyase
MTGEYCSMNGILVPASSALIPVDDIDFAYGFGVYETLKVRKRILYFPELHEERLFHSAKIIGLAHLLRPGEVKGFTIDLIRANRTENANVKILLIGADSPEKARLFIMTLNPLFPERRDYKNGAAAVIYPGERLFPEAKTLNMLMSTIAFRSARRAGAYDAILRDGDGLLTEGTRTNLFFTDGERVFTPPGHRVLEGVTKITLTSALRAAGIEVEERDLPETDLERYPGYFLTSTSTKVMPLRLIGGHETGIPEIIPRIMQVYDEFLTAYAAGAEELF